MKNFFLVFLYALSFTSANYSQTEYWKPISGPFGGLILSLVVQGDTIFAGGQGGLFISTNKGSDWNSLGFNEMDITQLIYCNHYLYAVGRSGGIVYNLINNSFKKINEYSLQTVAAIDSMVFIGGEYGGVKKSTNYGSTWVSANNGIDNYDIEKIFITSNGTVLASAAGASGNDIFRSTDWGESWHKLSYPFPPYTGNFAGICEFNSKLFSFSFSNNAIVYVSTDYGLTWSLPQSASPPSDIITSIHADEKGVYTGCYRFGFFASVNEGRAWGGFSGGLINKDVFDIKSDSENVYIATYSGIYAKRKNENIWKSLNNGLVNLNITDILYNNGKLFAASYGSGLFISEDLGENWVQNTISSRIFIRCIENIDGLIYGIAGTSYPDYTDVVIKSVNNGASWQELSSGFDTGGLRCIAGNKYALFVGSGYGLFKSTNKGNTWEKLLNGMPSNIVVSDLAVYDSTILFVNGQAGIYKSSDLGLNWNYYSVPESFSLSKIKISNDGKVTIAGNSQVNRLHQSSDLGKSWSIVSTPLFNAYVTDILFYEDKMAASLSKDGGVIKSNGIDFNWYQCVENLNNRDVNSLENVEGVLFAGTNGSGISLLVSSDIVPIPFDKDTLQSNNLNVRWYKLPGIENYRVQLFEQDNLVFPKYDATLNDTIFSISNLDFKTNYSWRVSSVTKFWDDAFSELIPFYVGDPNTFTLYQNFPNPFNNTTVIKFDLPATSKVEIFLYDILGRQLRNILEDEMEIGTHKVNLTLNDFASGVYFYQIKAGSFIQTKKLMLLK